jgi:serine/threonine-protein kinase
VGRKILTPAEALHVDELARLRMFSRFVLALALLVLPGTWLFGGDPTARWIMVGGLSVAAVGAVWAWIGLDREPEKLVRYQIGFGFVCVAVVSCAFVYFGPFSPALIIVTFGAFIFVVGQSLRGAAAITLVLIAIHLAISLLIITGVVRDRGIFRPIGLSTAAQLGCLALVHFVYVATFFMARRMRDTAARTLEELHRTATAAAQRELLLAEARQDLFQALQVGGPGRYTEQTIGRYRLGVLLGRGGMGEVYEAVDEETDETYALKLLHPHLVEDGTHYERFRREAELSASLNAPNVVRVVDVSPVGHTPPFLVMERLRGWDLSSRLKQKPRLDASDAVEMVRQVAAGLEAAHAAGIVHRDLKPQNLFCVEGTGTWKILDFGASTLREHHGTLTAGAVIGTPQYMAPEQARGERVDHRADVYALAVIAYRALTGTPAFPAADVPAVLFAVQHRMPPRPSQLAPLPPQVDDVLLVGLAKDAVARFTSAAELARALHAAMVGNIEPDVRARAWTLAGSWPWGEMRA